MHKSGDKHSKNPLSLLWEFLTSEHKELGVIFTYEIGVGVLSLVIPIGVQTVVNTIAFTQLVQPVVFLAVAVLLGQIVAAILKILQVIIVEKLQQRVFSYVGLELAYRIPRMIRTHDLKYPELVNRFFDVITIQKSISSLFIEGIALVLQMLIGLILLAFYHPVLLAFDIVLVLAIFIVLFLFGRGAVDSSINESIEKYKFVAWLEEVAEKSVTFGSRSARYYALERANDFIVQYLDARQTHFRIVMRQVIGFLSLQAVANATLLILGVWLITKNQLSIGQLVAAEIVVSTVLYSLARTRKHLDSYYDLCAALDKVGSLLEQPLEEMGVEALDCSGPIAIELKNVTYSYTDTSITLGPIDLAIKPGLKLAIHGANGSGKSTLVDLLFGLKKPSSGVITIDNEDMRRLSLESLREKVSLLRGIEIVQGSIIKNVRLGRPAATPEEVRDVLTKMGLLDEILDLPQGLDTELSASGSPLSVSQAKRLMIARILVNNPSLILIDETLDSLDDEAKTLAIDALFSKDSPWTIMVTSTHPEIEDKCDAILNLDVIKRGVQ
jgi:putative ABC transport system ATP-binding protein